MFCTFLPILFWVYIWHFHYEQFPFKSHPVLPFLDLSQSMDYTAPHSTVQVFIFHNYGLTLPGYLNSTVPWAYMGKVPTKDLRVVYLQFVSPHWAILNLLNGHGFMHIAVIYGRTPSTTQWWESCYLNQQVTLYS